MTQSKNAINSLQAGIILFTLVTAGVHLTLNFPDVMFILNGVGYLVLLAGLTLPQFSQYRSFIRWALVAFAAITILGWVAIGARTTVGYFDKVVEVVLILLLVLDSRQK